MERPCKDCKKYFEPSRRYRNYCEECRNKPKRRGGGHLHKKIKSSNKVIDKWKEQMKIELLIERT